MSECDQISFFYTQYKNFFFFNDTTTTEIYTLSLHDALPISGPYPPRHPEGQGDHIQGDRPIGRASVRSEEHTSELQSRFDLVCRLLLEKKKNISIATYLTTAKYIALDLHYFMSLVDNLIHLM